jgi:hypothetical protein
MVYIENTRSTEDSKKRYGKKVCEETRKEGGRQEMKRRKEKRKVEANERNMGIKA